MALLRVHPLPLQDRPLPLGIRPGRAFRRLLVELGDALVPVAVFAAAALAVYLPGRYLVLPGARRVLDAAPVKPTVELPLLKLVHASIGLVALFAAATLSGLASFLAATAALTAGLTVAIGFASRDVLSNLVSGVFIVLDPTFDIGDWIRWNDREGIIEDISFRVTRVHTFDNELISVPNSELTTNAVVNPVAKDRRRLSETIAVSVENDVDLVRDLLTATARAHPDVLDRPAPTAQVDAIEETSILFVARFWIRRPERADVVRIRSEFVGGANKRFAAAGVEMPSYDLGGTVALRSPADADSLGE